MFKQVVQVKITFCIEYRTFLFNAALTRLEIKNYNSAYKYIKECYKPIVEIEQCYSKMSEKEIQNAKISA